MDPFLDLIRLLRPNVTVWGGLDAFGQWAMSFRKRNDLLFCWIERGECQLIRPGARPVHLETNDFILIRTSAPFTLGSDASITPVDSEAAVAAAHDTKLRLGDGSERPVALRAGRFVFDTANEDLLAGLMPSLVHIGASDTSSSRIRALLAMNEMESRHPAPGSDYIIVRLMELILVEVFRTRDLRVGQETIGLIAGLADPVVARALVAMHKDAANGWTVSRLAQLSGASRSTFAARFRKVMGIGPIEYLLNWRMALAKDELRRGTRNISEIALAVGFQSASAFSTAFTRAVGYSPRHVSVATKAVASLLDSAEANHA